MNILPAEIAAELKEKGRAEKRDFDMVSILFTDFKEFTQASQQLSAKELVQEINTCFEAFDKICQKYGIEKKSKPLETPTWLRVSCLCQLKFQ
ncbi:MAG: adenylate/guanylate cyclase domain-containing protein [Bacteroidia bacterium]